jgi:hypothetical protein
MSWQATGWVWEHSRAEGTARLVLLAIAWHANPDGEDAWPSQATLAAKCRVSVRTVRRALDDLVAIGEVQVLAYSGPVAEGRSGRRTHRYRLTMVAADLSGNWYCKSDEVLGHTGQVVGQKAEVVGQNAEVVGHWCPGNSPLEPSFEKSQNAEIFQSDRLAVRLADNIDTGDYDEWFDLVIKLRSEGIGDTVIDEAVGQTISKVQSGHVDSPRGYLMKVARDWYQQRTA